MLYTLDRIEEGRFAVLVGADRSVVELPVAALPAGAAPGHVLARDASGTWRIDEAATQAAAARIRRKMDALWD